MGESNKRWARNEFLYDKLSILFAVWSEDPLCLLALPVPSFMTRYKSGVNPACLHFPKQPFAGLASSGNCGGVRQTGNKIPLAVSVFARGFDRKCSARCTRSFSSELIIGSLTATTVTRRFPSHDSSSLRHAMGVFRLQDSALEGQAASNRAPPLSFGPSAKGIRCTRS